MRTKAALLTQALELFEAKGYEQTTAAEIAAGVGVSEMTFFRHFPSKDQLLLDDPYDDQLIRAVAARPVEETPLSRTVNGLRSAWATVPESAVEVVRRRTRLVAATPALRAAVARNNLRTEDALTGQLVADGCDELRARAASSAVLGALTAALLWWAGQETADLSSALERALSVFDPATAPVSR